MTDLSPQIKTKIKVKLIAALLVTSFAIGYAIENTRNNHQLMIDARRLNSAISEPIEWIETLSIHMGRKIVEHDNYNDLQFIDNLFKETQRLQGLSNRIVSWSMFSWSNRKHRLMVNTLDGISKNPEDLVERQYTWRSRYNPWMLQITKTGRGMLSNLVIIPVAVGVSNSRDEFQGAIISGINAKELLNTAEAVIHSDNAFLVVNRDTFHSDPDKIMIASSNSPHVAKDYEKLPDLVKNLKDWLDPSGSVPVSITAGRYKYSYYSLIEGYQLAVLVGFDRVKFWENVFALGLQLFVGSMAILFLANEVGHFGRRRRS